jgi:NIPSNAP
MVGRAGAASLGGTEVSAAMQYELRQYWAKPGRRAELVRMMDHDILPFQVSCGVDVVASFVAAEDSDAYVWIRRWSSDEQRERVIAAVYDSTRWTDELMPAVRALISRERTIVTMLDPTAGSPLR